MESIYVVAHLLQTSTSYTSGRPPVDMLHACWKALMGLALNGVGGNLTLAGVHVWAGLSHDALFDMLRLGGLQAPRVLPVNFHDTAFLKMHMTCL
jgi:hypothetical protein